MIQEKLETVYDLRKDAEKIYEILLDNLAESIGTYFLSISSLEDKINKGRGIEIFKDYFIHSSEYDNLCSDGKSISTIDVLGDGGYKYGYVTINWMSKYDIMSGTSEAYFRVYKHIKNIFVRPQIIILKQANIFLKNIKSIYSLENKMSEQQKIKAVRAALDKLSKDKTIIALAHELRHAFDYERGDESYHKMFSDKKDIDFKDYVRQEGEKAAFTHSELYAKQLLPYLKKPFKEYLRAFTKYFKPWKAYSDKQKKSTIKLVYKFWSSEQ